MNIMLFNPHNNNILSLEWKFLENDPNFVDKRTQYYLLKLYKNFSQDLSSAKTGRFTEDVLMIVYSLHWSSCRSRT